jgi:hypothetical protein
MLFGTIQVDGGTPEREDINAAMPELSTYPERLHIRLQVPPPGLAGPVTQTLVDILQHPE